jgi:hypothetical protein
VAANGEEAGGLAQGELAMWDAGIRKRALAHLQRAPAWPRRWRIAAIALLLILHTAGLILVRRAMHPNVSLPQAKIEVRLIAAMPEPALPEPPVHAAHVLAREALRASAPRTPAAPAPAREAVATQELRLFNADGSLQLQAEKSFDAMPERQAAELRSRGHNIIHCRQTRFAQGYRRDATVGEEVSRRYLKWIGLYNAAYVEAKAAQREAEHAAACDD